MAMASCLGHILKEGANILEMCRRENSYLCRQAAATFQVFVYVCALVCAEFYLVHSLLQVVFASDGYVPPYPWQLILIDAIIFFLLVVLFVKIYLDEFVLDKMK